MTRCRLGWLAVAAGIGLVAACGAGESNDARVRRDEPLRVLGADAGIRIGSAVDDEALTTDRRYAALLIREVDVVVAENVMKWSTLQPERGEFDFEAADRLVEFAESNGMTVRGHALLWSRSDPEWVINANWERDEAIDVLRTHIETVVGRYAGRVAQWDVVNEPIARDERELLEPSPWLRMIGPEYLDLAFEFARGADPDAALHLNDFDGSFPATRVERAVALAGDLVGRGVPIDGVGVQFHLRSEQELRADDIDTWFGRLDDLGLDAVVTEADVRIDIGDGAPTADDLERQADIFGTLVAGCRRAPNCDTFVMWGITDRWSWIPDRFEGTGAATVFDADYRPKPAHERLQLELS